MIALSRDSLSPKVGMTGQLSVSNLVDRTLTWTCSSKKIATLKNGKITALRKGKCTVTAKIKNGKTLKCRIVVKGRRQRVSFPVAKFCFTERIS